MLTPVMPKQNLREHFELSGETQQQFAARVGITQGYVSKLIAGASVPSLAMAIRIASAADIPVESLAISADSQSEAVAS